MKPWIHDRGDRENTYLRVTLRRRGGKHNPRIHILVARLFVPNPHRRATVNHINGDTHDNRAVNLEWLTRLQNIRHATVNGFLRRN